MTSARAHQPDRGSATVYALAVMAALCAIGLGAATVGGAVVARHRAMSAADLAALAGADALVRADSEPCAVAARIAARHRAELIGCHTDGLVVDVVVGVPLGGLSAFDLMAHMRARAGPADAP